MKTLLILAALMFPPAVSWAANLPPAALGAKVIMVEKVASYMPAWEADSSAQYEQLEIAAVRLDVLSCEMAATADDFSIDFEQLRKDIGTLVALDLFLERRFVL